MLSVQQSSWQNAFVKGESATVGMEFAAQYANASPFPHIVIDDFMLPDELRPLLAEFPDREGKLNYQRAQERLKYGFAPWEVKPGPLQELLQKLNSAAFMEFLEALTGIKGLIPDPYYNGGGLHETLPGGHLGIHADFNIHPRLRLQRRLNFLLYLNDDWSSEYGGDLELWDQDMRGCQSRIAPVIGRAVVFNTDLQSYHGHPDPLRCPEGKTRRSIATYYYTAPENGVASLPKRTTSFQPRTGTTDKTDWAVKYRHAVNDWVPQRLQPLAFKFGNRFLT